MKKFAKKSLALLLVAVLAVCAVPMANASIDWGRSVYISAAGQVVDSITFNGKTVNAVYAPRSSISNYDSDSTYCCAAFVKRFYKTCFGVTVSNLFPGQQTNSTYKPSVSSGSFSRASSPVVGDILSSTGHWTIVKAVNGNTVTIIEQNCWNGDYTCAKVDRKITLPDSEYQYIWHYSGNSGGNSGAGHNPEGQIEGCSGGPACVFLNGWAFDRDDLSTQIDLHVYIGGWVGVGEQHVVHSGYPRPDINSVYGCGDNHGVYTTIPTKKTGTQEVWIYAINIGTGENVYLTNTTVSIKTGYAMELNSRLDNASRSDLGDFATVDFYVDNELIGKDLTDISAENGRFAWGSNYEIIVKPKPGYTYAGVWAGSTKSRFTEETLPLTISFYTNTSTLKVDPNGGVWNGSASPQSITKTSGTIIEIAKPTRNGYTFAGWEKNITNGSFISIAFMVTNRYCYGTESNVTDTITAKWNCNHERTTIQNKANATCTAAGNTGDTVCSVCGVTVSFGTPIPALNHTAPDANGNCTRCGTHIKDVQQPTNPTDSTQQQQSGGCPYCGGTHGGMFGWLVQLLHTILALFGLRK